MILYKENLRYITFTTRIADSDGEPIPGTERERTIMFNISHISAKEVEDLINSDRWEFDKRIVEIPTESIPYITNVEG